MGKIVVGGLIILLIFSIIENKNNVEQPRRIINDPEYQSYIKKQEQFFDGEFGENPSREKINNIIRKVTESTPIQEELQRVDPTRSFIKMYARDMEMVMETRLVSSHYTLENMNMDKEGLCYSAKMFLKHGVVITHIIYSHDMKGKKTFSLKPKDCGFLSTT